MLNGAQTSRTSRCRRCSAAVVTSRGCITKRSGRERHVDAENHPVSICYAGRCKWFVGVWIRASVLTGDPSVVSYYNLENTTVGTNRITRY